MDSILHLQHDITSEISAPVQQQQCADEVIINCRQQQKHHQQQQQQQKPFKHQTKPEQSSPSSQPTAVPPSQVFPLKHQQHQQQQQQQQQQNSNKIIARSQSSKVIHEIQQQQQQQQNAIHQLKQQQSLPAALHTSNNNNHNNSTGIGVGGIGIDIGGGLPTTPNASSHHHPHASKSVSILVYKTLNTVFKSSRKIIVRVCEVASVKKSFTMFKFNKAAAQNRAENRANACTGHDTFVRPPVPEKKVKHLMKKLHKQNGLKRSNSAIEFDVSALTAANRRHIYSRNRSASSADQDNQSDQSEHSEKSPLVSARLDNLARLFFSKSMPAETGSRDTIESVLTTRPNLKYQYSALDSGNGIVERSPRERAHRERALNATQEWIQNTNGRYEVIAHLDEIGSRHGKNWFLVTDSSVRTDRLLTLLPLPPDCVALEDVPANDNPQGMLMELLGSLHHPYIYPVLDLGFLCTNSTNYACLVTPFNSRGSLKDLIYKAQWNEPWARKYTRKPNGLPVTQVQRLGRQILEALLFLKERGFPLHGHLHSGNVILQNGAARLSGLENGLLGLSSRINAVIWSRSTTEIENVDIICFGHLLYEMCTGQEMTTPKPSMRVLEMELESYPQILDILGLIFEPPSGVCPSVEELVLCDLFRSIDLRELRGPCFSTIKPSLSRSTLNLLHAVKKRQCASLGNSFSEASSPSSPPSTPRGDSRRSGISRTMDSFEVSSDSEEGLLDEIVVGSNYHQQQLQCMQYYQKQQSQQHQRHHYSNNAAASSCYHQYAQHFQPKQLYEPIESPIHYCDNAATHSDDNSYSTQENQQQQQKPTIRCSSSSSSNLNISLVGTNAAYAGSGGGDGGDGDGDGGISRSSGSSTSVASTATTTTAAAAAAATAIMSHHDDEYGDEVSGYDNKATTAGQLELVEYGCAANNESEVATSHQQTDISNVSGIAACKLQASTSAAAAAATAGASFNHQLTADMCSYKNSKSRRLEYSLKCLKYGRSNPSQDSAFGSLTDNDFSAGSSSLRISSFQSISSPIDEGVEDVIIATTTCGNETCLELATIPRNMVSQDSAISSPCRESSPSNFLNIDDGMSGGSCSGGSSSSGSTGNVRPQQFPVSLSPKILVTATTNSSNSSLSSTSAAATAATTAAASLHQQQQQPQQFDPPKILVNDQNSIYTTSPSKRSGTIEVFSQKYRVSSFEDMSPNKRSASTCSEKHLKNVNRMAFRSLEEERRIDSAFMPITDRTNSENRVNMQSEKYKKLTHASFRISKTSSQVAVYDTSPGQLVNTTPLGSTTMLPGVGAALEMQRPATAYGGSTSSSRQTMWRDSKFYRKNRIAKSNDSLLETSPNHSIRLSPSSLRDNQYDSCSSHGGSRSHSRHSLNRGESINEISSSNQTLGLGLAVMTSFCGNANGRRYCSSKSEDLGETSDYLRVMDARKSYSERHLVTLTKLKQTAINNTMSGSEQCCFSEDEMSFNDDNNPYGYQQYQQYRQQQQQASQQYQQQQRLHRHHHHQQHRQQQPQQPCQKQQNHQSQHSQQQQQYSKRPHPNQLSWSSCSINRLKTTNIKTTSLATLSCHQNLTYAASSSIHSTTAATTAATAASFSIQQSDSIKMPRSVFKSLDHELNIINDGSGGGRGAGNSSTYTGTEENSSPDDSPSRRTLSAAELSKIFAMDDAQGSSCSEEKTPLLDSVEMSPISPTGPQLENNDEQQM